VIARLADIPRIPEEEPGDPDWHPIQHFFYLTATIDGVGHEVDAGTVVALADPATRRSAVALEPGTTIIAVGGEKRERFETSWLRHHFEGVPQVGI
jgi:hypothetical protein